MIDTPAFVEYLGASGLDFYAGVPDSLLADLCAFIADNVPAKNNIVAANEGSAVAIASGYYLATGKPGVVYMQNSGEGNIVNPLLSLADPEVYSIPMLLVIGWRGEPGTKDEPQHVKQGKVTLELLDTMGVPYLVLGDDWQSQIDHCIKFMQDEKRPIAIIVRKDAFSKYKLTAPSSNLELTREAALETILNSLGADDFVVSTTGKTSREIFELRERENAGHGNDFLTVGSMGHTASIAFGISQETDKNVYCIDGDGSFIMHMGSLAVVAQNAGANFRYILINNGSHESVGGQPTVGFDIDIEGILRAQGFSNVRPAKTLAELQKGMGQLVADGGALVIYTRQGSRPDLGRPTTTPLENRDAFMEQIAK